MATKIAGIAVYPRESRNKIFYHTEELEKFDGVVAPLRHDHDPSPEAVIGSVKFHYDPDKQQVRYEAEITDPEWQELVDRKNFLVSIGATVDNNIPPEEQQMCDDTGRTCLNAPVLQSIDELSLVETPGNPEVTLNVIEGNNYTGTNTASWTQPNSYKGSNKEYLPCGTQVKDCEYALYTSDKTNINQSNIMAEETSPKEKTKVEEKTDKKVNEKVKISIETNDEIEVEGKETKDDKKEEAPEPEKSEETEAKVETKPAEETEKIDVAKTSKEVAESVTKEFTDAIRENWIPKSEVNESVKGVAETEAPYTDEEAEKIMEKLKENGFVNLTIDKEDYMKSHLAEFDKKTQEVTKVTEAVSTSGTIPIVKANTNIIITKDGKTELSVRQWGQFEDLPTGANTARFYTMTVPDAGAITETVTTDITAVTSTFTAIDVTCAVRGWRQTILRSQFEDFPATFLNTLRETARIESVRDEHRLIVQDIAGTDHDFNGASASGILAAHISADDGAAVTDATEEDAAAQLLPDGLTIAKRILQVGHEPNIGPNALIAFLAPIAFENLYTATALSEYTMIGNPTVTRLGEIEKIYGIDIVVTNELLVQNNAFRNLLCTKGKCWALASQRSMNIQMQDWIASQYTNVVWTHHIGVDVLDANAYVIISGPNT